MRPCSLLATVIDGFASRLKRRCDCNAVNVKFRSPEEMLYGAPVTPPTSEPAKESDELIGIVPTWPLSVTPASSMLSRVISASSTWIITCGGSTSRPRIISITFSR